MIDTKKLREAIQLNVNECGVFELSLVRELLDHIEQLEKLTATNVHDYIEALEARTKLLNEHIDELETENQRLRDEMFALSFHGCITGDCPHDSYHQCAKSLREAIVNTQEALNHGIKKDGG